MVWDLCRKVRLTHWVNDFHRWILWSHLIILHGAVIKHELLCSHKPMGRDGEMVGESIVSWRETIRDSTRKSWGFVPGSKSNFIVNEPQNSCGALEFQLWRSQVRFSASASWVQCNSKNSLRGHLKKKSPHHLCSDRAAREWHWNS